MRYWKPEDIFTGACPHCGAEIEFWKDEPLRACAACRKEVRNPKLDPGCAEWCRHGSTCLGGSAGDASNTPDNKQAPAGGTL